VLLAIIELTGEVGGPWQGRLAALGWALWSLFLAFIGTALGFLVGAGAPEPGSRTSATRCGGRRSSSPRLAAALPRHRRRRRPGLRAHGRRYMLVTYCIGSVASVLVALDARPAPKPRQDGVELNEYEVEALRSILKKADGT
jgi:hypothetical protein